MNILDQSFYAQDTISVARNLLGKQLISTIHDELVSGIIVETEAYRYRDDKASHAYRGKKRRNCAMFGAVGHAYVYFVYGNHFCFNVVARDAHFEAGAVLIRALQVCHGASIMVRRRKKSSIYELTNGPGKLTQACGISRSHNGLDLTQGGELYLAEGISVDDSAVIATSRIGITVACDKPWRFFITHNKWISRRI